MPPRHERIGVHNGRIALAARTHPPVGVPGPVAFLCECDDEGCAEQVTLRLDEFDRLREDGGAVVAPAHVRTG
ncbi:MAG TPA: hypothetical protein VHC01_02505 [Gaiellaceae bacterium]|nr:hypothetical protein [Gaiellaceae bacterium]